MPIRTNRPRWLLTLAMAVSIVTIATPAFADRADTEVRQSDEDAAAEGIAFAGSAFLETSIGRGTFITDPDARRAYVNVLLSLRPRLILLPSHGLSLEVRLDMDVNAIESVDSDRIAPHEVRVGDLRIGVRADEIVTVDEATFTLSGRFDLVLPTSKESRFLTKVMGLRAALGAGFEPLPWLAVDYSFAVTRNFHLYNTPVVNTDDFKRPPVARVGGAEMVAEGLVAQGGHVTGWVVSNGLDITFTPIEPLAITLSWGVAHAFRDVSYPDDDLYASPHATAGVGQSDVMWGGLEVSYAVHDHVDLALGSWTEQAPKTADGEAFRFPFWDTTNGAANRQVFYLTVTGSLPPLR